jgi:sugar phosphate isomerase/epimerase
MHDRLSVISDGISPDFLSAVKLLSQEGLRFVELQTLYDKAIGDLSPSEMREVRNITSNYGVQVCCVSRKNLFGSLSVATTTTGDIAYQAEVEVLRRLIGDAQELGTNLIRIMSFRKETVLFGNCGAEDAVVTRGAWDKFVELMGRPVRLAEAAGVQLVVETCLRGMITSARLGRRLVDEVASGALKVLWDPCNALYYNEPVYPEGYEVLRGGYLGHIHLKDGVADIPGALIDFAAMGEGQLGPHLRAIAQGLGSDGYDGFISLENVFRPEHGGAEAGFRASVRKLKDVFH